MKSKERYKYSDYHGKARKQLENVTCFNFAESWVQAFHLIGKMITHKSFNLIDIFHSMHAGK